MLAVAMVGIVNGAVGLNSEVECLGAFKLKIGCLGNVVSVIGSVRVNARAICKVGCNRSCSLIHDGIKGVCEINLEIVYLIYLVDKRAYLNCAYGFGVCELEDYIGGLLFALLAANCAPDTCCCNVGVVVELGKVVSAEYSCIIIGLIVLTVIAYRAGTNVIKLVGNVESLVVEAYELEVVYTEGSIGCAAVYYFNANVTSRKLLVHGNNLAVCRGSLIGVNKRFCLPYLIREVRCVYLEFFNILRRVRDVLEDNLIDIHRCAEIGNEMELAALLVDDNRGIIVCV